MKTIKEHLATINNEYLKQRAEELPPYIQLVITNALTQILDELPTDNKEYNDEFSCGYHTAMAELQDHINKVKSDI